MLGCVGSAAWPIAYRDARMAEIATTTVPANGLPVYSVGLPGTRALTVLVAFDAGARTERAEENGMAHFLEHLVFKGERSSPPTRTSTRPPSGSGAC